MLRLHQIAANLQPNQEFIYSVPIGEKKKGETRIMRHPQSAQGLLQPPQGIKNLSDFWDACCKRFSNHKIIQQITYLEADTISEKIGSWIIKNQHQKIFLYCKNCPEWTLTDIASWKYGFITIPLYDTLGSEAFDYILKLTQGSLICITGVMSANLISHLKREKGNINTVIIFDSISEDHKKQLQNLNLTVILMQNIIQSTQILPRPNTLNLDSHLTYAFTSGTTGLPKGVIQTHRMAIVQSLSMKGHYQYFDTDVHMSFLPIAHTFQRFITWVCIYFGTQIRYSKHPPTEILKDLATIKPTTIIIVPRLLNKLYPVMKQMYEKQHNKAKIKAIFGGRLTKIVTGSAPVSAEILTFLLDVLECDVRQGYGQTETTAASFVTYKGDKNYGHVGGPNKCTQFKLVDVPEMNYTTDGQNPKGEICIRGDSIFKQYYKDPKNTLETVDQDGWNHSGDIGMILPNGALKIIDRKKNIFKLSQGQYVAPEKVQNIYLRCKYVAECFLYGDSLRDYNIAIVHPTLQLLPTIAKQLQISETDIQKLCSNKKIVSFIQNEMGKQSTKDGLFGFQTAKKILLWPKSFATYGIFTSTLKLNRHIAKNTFKKQIESLYNK